ncbi:cytochrome c oxidase accessory protein CcoG [Antarcticirhabdus aurantiaca]|uniref:Cytochrome c oxidase accessory protein CcoG n=1 Tax=Antarcticirhabdus aurantiaca TaxID=2606717 RepID=A0ACD4NRN8_9HYPH|nr:cytochrome c oxidase accessory protein CcoG [Antarcticirhabdus aurantiaca]WAJ29499.1 cytochrome c oxidase accessory protein CcoG [Jeongeuplla avenae]
MATLIDTIRNDPRSPRRGLQGVGAEPVRSAEPVNDRELRSDYEARRHIFPSRVHGAFRRIKWTLVALLLGIYWGTPWIRWDRGPAAPDQAVLLDLARRRFYFFGIEIWPQEFYYVAGLLIMAALGLFLVTSVAGRAWCGYACPQTVWTDLFIAVERLVEGDRNARAKLDASPWTLTKIRKRLTLWSLWLVIAAATGGAWVFYFADAPTLLVDLVSGTAAPVAYTTVALLAATTFWLAGFMREQVCTYMCPWPRIQGAMLDEHSLIVTYNDWRGEPRSRHAKKAIAAGRDVGDCVDCNACVAACPMGIDIRNGQQLECITCALCIDACNRIMEKVGKPRGLVSYSTLADYERHAQTAATLGRDTARAEQRGPSISKVLRPRTILYFGLWATIGVAMLVALAARGEIGMTVLHDRAPLFTTLSDGSVRNGYELKLVNKAGEPRSLALAIQGLPDATMWTAENGERTRSAVVDVPPDSVRDLRVFVLRPAANAAPADFAFVLTDPRSNETVVEDARFEAKEVTRK